MALQKRQKSIDLAADTYQKPGDLYSKLKTYAAALKHWDGQKQTLQRPRLLEQEFDQKVLHIGIKDGSMTTAQRSVRAICQRRNFGIQQALTTR